jgi:CubicO group peptidase (beta-lactamase class C family)
LYLSDGKLGAKQILPLGWVKAASTPTLGAGYGRGFWLNNTHSAHPLPGHWGIPGAPADAYFARGYLGQFIVIVPSLDLVVVRLGISYRHGGDIETVGEMVGEIAAALPQ